MTTGPVGGEQKAARHWAKFSPSKLDCFKECPRRYKFRYIDRIKSEECSVESFLGDCVHKTFESLYEDVRHGKVPPAADLLARYEALWTQGWSAEIKLRGEYTPEDWRAVGRQCVSGYYEAHRPFSEDRTVGIEEAVGFELEADGEKIRVAGYVDRLANKDGVFEIHDYKTGKSLPTQEDVDSDWQLAIYDIAVRRMWGEAVADTRLLWHYVRHGVTLRSARSPERRQALLEELAALVSRIKREQEFPPFESGLCSYCEYRALCPLFAHAEQAAAGAAAAADGQALVDRLSAVEARKKELRAELKALELEAGSLEESIVRYAGAHKFSRVSGAYGEATVVEKEELKLPTKTSSPKAHEELEAALKALPVWPEISHLDAHGLLAAYEGGAWSEDVRARVGELLSRYGKTVRETAVRLRRRKEAEDD